MHDTDTHKPIASIPLAGVIGWPVAQSRSPALHAHWLRRYGIAGAYVPMAVLSEHLGQVLHTLPKAGFVGVNVTIPHKEAVLALADIVTDRAALIGAANTLIFRPDGRLHADNTDGYGFIANLQQHTPDWSASAGPAAVIGAGGAARAVVAALLECGVPELRIANRTRIRAEQIKAEFGARVIVHDWVQAGAMLEGAVLRGVVLVAAAEADPDDEGFYPEDLRGLRAVERLWRVVTDVAIAAGHRARASWPF